VLGVVLAGWGVRLLASIVPEDLPRATNISVNVTVLTFSSIVTIAAGFIFGVVPAVYASTPDLSAFLKEARRDGGSVTGRRRFARAIVTVEVALALMLLAGAGLAIRSFDRLNRVDPGFDPSNVLAVNVALPDARYPDNAAMARFFRSFVDALAAQPGAVTAGAVMQPPLSPSGFGGTFTILGRADVNDQRMQVRPATHGYFEALRIPVRRGRLFTATDDGASAHVAILSEEAARRFWPGEDPVGKRIRIHVSINVREREREVVGVVGDVKIRSLQSPPAAVVYVPYAQYVADQMTVFVRTAGDPRAFAPGVRAELARIDRDVAPANVRPATDMVASSMAQLRFRTMMLGLFAGMALALAAIGLYGVMAYAVGQRRNELGLRMALGADAGDVIRLVLGDGLIPVAAGIAAGLLCAGALTRIMSTLAIGISPLDPLTFTAVPLLLACVACAACYIPARRATKVDPVTALRHE
jgi:putative ABC transport system permease protein